MFQRERLRKKDIQFSLASSPENQTMSEEILEGKEAGIVHIVGAGPGDPGLVTLKAKELIEHCDSLLYDYLVDDRLLDWVKEDCKLICVGKRPGMHSMEQAAIHHLLVEEAKAGREVVRLKGGDPLIFGRGGEEVVALQKEGIAVDVIPGITSGIAAASRLLKPLTHREHASTLLFLTGHEDPLKHRPRIDWKQVVVDNSTIVLYMGMKHLEDISNQLMQAGKDPETPAAILQWVTTPKEKIVKTKLGDLAAQAVEHQMAAPAIVIIGSVLS